MHHFNCKTENSKNYNNKVYRMIRDNGGWENFKFMIISQFNCTSKIELHIEEERLRCNMKATLNSYKSHRTEQEIIDQKKKIR